MRFFRQRRRFQQGTTQQDSEQQQYKQRQQPNDQEENHFPSPRFTREQKNALMHFGCCDLSDDSFDFMPIPTEIVVSGTEENWIDEVSELF